MDGSVSASNGTARVERAWNLNPEDLTAWSAWEGIVTGLSFPNGTSQVSYNLKANISSTSAGLWRYQLVACDNVPGGATEASGTTFEKAEVDVNAAPTVSADQSSVSYTSFGSRELKWNINDAHLVNGNATYKIYKVGVADPIKNGTWSQYNKQVTITCSGDWIAFNTASRTLDYWIVVDDGYQRQANHSVPVTVLRSREYHFENWDRIKNNGGINTPVPNSPSISMYVNQWWCPDQDWWSYPHTWKAPRMQKTVPNGNWWATVMIPAATFPFVAHCGLMLRYSEGDVAFFGPYGNGNSYSKARLERIDGSVGYNYGASGTWDAGQGAFNVAGYDIFAIKCWNNQYEFTVYNIYTSAWYSSG